jgi:hypothetical protein
MQRNQIVIGLFVIALVSVGLFLLVTNNRQQPPATVELSTTPQTITVVPQVTPTPAAVSEESTVQPEAEAVGNNISPLAAPEGDSPLPTPPPFERVGDGSELEIEAGRASVTGRAFSDITLQPIANTTIRLAEIFYADETRDPTNAAWALNNASSPYTETDSEGFFLFRNVEARGYVIFVGDILGQYTVELTEEGTPRPYEFGPDVLHEVGNIFVDYVP